MTDERERLREADDRSIALDAIFAAWADHYDVEVPDEAWDELAAALAHEGTSASCGRQSDRPSGSHRDVAGESHGDLNIAAGSGLREALDEAMALVTGPGNGTLTRQRSIEEWQRLYHVLDDARAALSGSTSSASADAEVSDPEAVGLDVERLARAMARCAEVGPPAHINPDDAEEHWPSYVAEAEEYAREYAALTEAKPESPA
jgi:hypothetical protein